MEPKYKTYEEVIEAYKSGELDQDKDVMIVDNDCCSIYQDEVCVFRGNGPYDFIEVLGLCGIPAEPC